MRSGWKAGWMDGRWWWPGWRRVLVMLAVVGGTALAAEVLYNNSDELFTAADDLSNLQPGWVVVAAVAEAVCYLARGVAQRQLLTSGAAGTEPPTDTGGAGSVVLAATSLAGDAVAYCLPFGFAAAGIVTLRVLRRRRIDEVLAGWTFGVATVLYVAVLAVLGVVAVQLAGDEGPVPGLQELSGIVLGLLAATVAVVLAARRWASAGLARMSRWVRVRRRLTLRTLMATGRGTATLHRALRRAPDRAGAWWAQLRLLRLTPFAVAVATAATLVSWLADIGVLGASYAALGAIPPWTGLLLAYCAGQIVSSVPITPGGIGVVEGSLTLALVAFGGSTGTTLAAVLLYRLISHWACIPAGGIAWLVLRATSRTSVAPDVEATPV